MTNIYEAKTNEDLREAVVDLCVQAIHLWKTSTNSVTKDNAAERIVPPVPGAYRIVPSAVASGLTFRCINGVVQAKHDSMDKWIDSISVTMPDVDVIADLKANPYVTPPSITVHNAPTITREQAVNALVYMGAELFDATLTGDGRDRLRLPAKKENI